MGKAGVSFFRFGSVRTCGKNWNKMYQLAGEEYCCSSCGRLTNERALRSRSSIDIASKTE